MNVNQVNLTKVVTTEKDLITLIPNHETLSINPTVPIDKQMFLWLKRLGYAHPNRLVYAIKHDKLNGTYLPKSISR